MRLKEFMRQCVGELYEGYTMWVKQYFRGSDKPAVFPVKNYGVNACGQLVLERDWSMTARPLEYFYDFSFFLEYLHPELKMFVADDWQKKCDWSQEVDLIEAEFDGDEHRVYFVAREHADNKLQNEHKKAMEKYHL